jgi:hypothetical protein
MLSICSINDIYLFIHPHQRQVQLSGGLHPHSLSDDGGKDGAVRVPAGSQSFAFVSRIHSRASDAAAERLSSTSGVVISA